MDGMDAFHAAYSTGRIVNPPPLYLELILIPAILHIEPMTFWDYPPAVQLQMRSMLQSYIRGGWAGNTAIVRGPNA